ncbi:hypothetical protein [Chitinophaga tropicalis]|uniref:Uncharacterized protein n=1 Tax=Chitinophaga tropicalis TaxID=2683588 RepID=A0A7K1U1W0_9BACT|nr:hypothetical protein [Chitinophaga tropicalis]MVT08337.1 hypothetical protein [Chitinophaga tropicalis]
MLDRWGLVKPIIDNGCRIIISEFRISYYSLEKQSLIKRMIGAGMVDLIDDGADALDFAEMHSSYMSHIGKGGLLVIHLCLTNSCVMVIEDEFEFYKEVAANFGVRSVSAADFFRQNVEDTDRREFLINVFK